MRIAPMVMKRLIYEIRAPTHFARGRDPSARPRPEPASSRSIDLSSESAASKARSPIACQTLFTRSAKLSTVSGSRAARGERALLIDEITPVEGEEHLRGAGERAERASGNVSLIASRNGRLRVLDAEQNLPLEAANERLAQGFRIGNGHRLQLSECALRIAEWPAKRDFAHPDRGAEAMRMARLIIHADAALAAVANDPLDQLDRPIEQVHLLAGDRRASRRPRSTAPSRRPR